MTPQEKAEKIFMGYFNGVSNSETVQIMFNLENAISNAGLQKEKLRAIIRQVENIIVEIRAIEKDAATS